MMNLIIYYRYVTDEYVGDREEWKEPLDKDVYAAIVDRCNALAASGKGVNEAEINGNEELQYVCDMQKFNVVSELFPDLISSARDRFVEKHGSNIVKNHPGKITFCDDCLRTEGCRLEDTQDGGKKKGARKLTLLYTVEFEGDDEDTVNEEESDPMSIVVSMPASVYKNYVEYRHKFCITEGEDSFDDIEDAVPDWSDDVYEKICDVETERFRKTVKKGEDFYDDCKDPDWCITDVADIFIDIDHFNDPE